MASSNHESSVGNKAAATLAATGQSGVVNGKMVDISLAGTWAGTVKLQRNVGNGWRDTGDEWTANAEAVAEAGSACQWRLDWTRVSGSLEYGLSGA